MSNQSLRVLHVEDDFADAMLVQHAVCEAGDFDIAFEVAGTLKDAKRKLAKEEFDLVLLDLRLPDSVHPIDTLETARDCIGETPLLVLSGSMSVDKAHLPDDVASLDKNESFRTEKKGEAPVHLAHLIREAAEASDIQTI
ncbi:response regulator [Maricaulis sp.]|uniref:response regulator n=1 Tax=Maricaulis sp. TaxID=1486257 RepID=UPI001B20785F|nr:response regulator [Maricaulis sp.]MBO6795982.1 response regulator [Maricaulis sp.]